MKTSADAPSVLIVDDEALVAEAVRQALALRGVPVSVAGSAEMAKARLAADPCIGVVLADINMPGQSGLDMAAEIQRDRPETHALEVIFMTGEGVAEHALDALRRQAFDFLGKPFRMREVQEVVARARAANAERRARARAAAAVAGRLKAAQAEGRRLAAGLAASRADLARTQAALTEAQEARSQLFAVISHELRTPLIPIIGFSDILIRNPAIPAQTLAEMAGAIHSGGARLLGLIENALDILELESDAALRLDDACAPAALLAEAAEAMQAAAAACGVTLRCGGGAADAPGPCDGAEGAGSGGAGSGGAPAAAADAARRAGGPAGTPAGGAPCVTDLPHGAPQRDAPHGEAADVTAERGAARRADDAATGGAARPGDGADGAPASPGPLRGAHATLLCDAPRLRRALAALLDNALRATPPGGVVAADCLAGEGGGVAFTVRDGGAGVPEAVLAALGRPFLQGDMSLTRAWSGAGLGLAFVKRVAEAHGGALTLCNAPGGGALARLALPARPTAAGAAAEAVAVAT